MNYTDLANQETVNKTKAGLESKGYQVFLLSSGSEALEKIKEIIPAGSSVVNGSSTTLDQIGYTDYLKSKNHKWEDLHALVNAENDKEKRNKLRRESSISDFYLGSVHALVQSGEFVIASNTGSQLPSVANTSLNLIFVVSTKKIVESLEKALKRLEEHVIKLEDERMMKAYGAHTVDNKILIFKGENPMAKRKIIFILVNQDLGF